MIKNAFDLVEAEYMQSVYEKWTKNLMDSWSSLEGSKTALLFSKDVKYYEAPMDVPCNSWEDVAKLWGVVPNNQKDITYRFNILCCTNDICIVNWKLDRIFIPTNEKQRIDGIFQISLNNEGLCNYFKQWRYTFVER